MVGSREDGTVVFFYVARVSSALVHHVRGRERRYSNRSQSSEKPGLLELLLSYQKGLKVFAAYVRNDGAAKSADPRAKRTGLQPL